MAVRASDLCLYNKKSIATHCHSLDRLESGSVGVFVLSKAHLYFKVASESYRNVTVLALHRNQNKRSFSPCRSYSSSEKWDIVQHF